MSDNSGFCQVASQAERGQLVYAGNFSGQNKTTFGDADETQVVYKQLFSERQDEIFRDLAIGRDGGNLIGILTYHLYDHGSSGFMSRVADGLIFNKFHYRFEMAEHINDSTTRSQFSSVAIPLLEAGGWGDHLVAIASELPPVSASD